jgi:GTP cyclohydrolase I
MTPTDRPPAVLPLAAADGSGRLNRDAHRHPVDLARAEAAVRELLIAVGEDPEREGLHETPARVARA